MQLLCIKKLLWRSPAAGKKGYSFFRPCAFLPKAENFARTIKSCFLYNRKYAISYYIKKDVPQATHPKKRIALRTATYHIIDGGEY